MKKMFFRNIFFKAKLFILHYTKLHIALKTIFLKVVSSINQVITLLTLTWLECSHVLLLVAKSFYCIRNDSTFLYFFPKEITKVWNLVPISAIIFIALTWRRTSERGDFVQSYAPDWWQAKDAFILFQSLQPALNLFGYYICWFYP